jgi:hypothetical protein
MVMPSDQAPGHKHTHEMDWDLLRRFILNPDMEVPMTTGIPPTNQPNEVNPEDLRGYDPQRRAVRDDVLTEAWPANVKRTYDEYQHESLEAIRRNRSYVDKVLSDAGMNNQSVEAVKLQALQNAVETANMLGKNAVTAFHASNERVSNAQNLFSDNVWDLNKDARIAAGVDPANTALLGEMVKALAQTSPANLGMFVEALKAVADKK